MLRMGCSVSFLVLLALVFGACAPVPLPRTPLPAVDETSGVVAPATPAPTVAPAVAATPRPTRPPRVKLTVEHGMVTSQALAGNLLGDPAERGFNVVLPSDYATSDKRYPVVYVLHGYTEDEYGWPFEFQRIQENALRFGETKEMILVFPNANNVLHGSMYLSSPTIGDYETYLTRELVEYVDAHYRTIPSRESRGITGCSMGADGALHLALKYPDVYSVAAPYSGTYDWMDPRTPTGLGDFLHEPADLNEFNKLPSFLVKWDIAAAAAIAPNPDKPPFFLDMPYVFVDGKASYTSSFLEKLEAASPVQDARRYAQQPLRLRNLLIVHGRHDDIAPVGIVRDVSALLAELGIGHEYLEVDAMHCNMDKEPILKFMSDNLVFEEPAP